MGFTPTYPASTTNDSALPYITGQSRPTWVQDPEEANRLAAYDLYDDLYDNSPDQFRLLLRGDPEDIPIYMPTAKQVVKTLGRYVARKLGFSVGSSGDLTLNDDVYAAVVTAYGDLFKRERFFSRFGANKKWGLVRGDFCFWLIADPMKPQGSRISIRPLDPRAYFPIVDLDDPERLLGCDIVHQETIDDKQYVRRQRYLKSIHPDHPLNDGETAVVGAPISYEELLLEESNWEDPEKQKIFQVVTPVELMPKEITALPVYHIKIEEQPNNPYGRSVLGGMERIFLGINQTVSDEDLALAMAGLGFYATDQQLEDGEDWEIGPKRVVETAPGGKFERVKGVDNIDSTQKHIDFLKNEVFQTLGINEVATGVITPGVADSGVALAIQLGPIVDESDEIDLVILDVLNHMFHDLQGWFAAFEGIRFPEGVVVSATVGDKMPTNTKQQLQLYHQLLEDKLVSRAWVRDRLTEELGITLPDTIQADIDRELQAEAAMLDPYGGRGAIELAGKNDMTDKGSIAAEEQGGFDEATL